MTSFRTGIKKGEDSFQVGKKAAENALEKMKEDKVDFAVVFSSSEHDYEEVVSGVREVTGNAELLGCSTAGEFTEEKVESGSVAVALISSDNSRFFTSLGKGLAENPREALERAKESLPENVEGYPYLSVINLHDGIAGVGSEVAWSTLEVLGQNIKVAGGSAGDDLNMKETYVFEDGKVEKDAVGLGLIASEKPTVITVEHGHEPISPPLEITKSEGNTIYELNGRPAYEVWKEQAKDRLDNIGVSVEDLEPGEELITALTRFGLGLESSRGYKVRWLGLNPRTDGPIDLTCNASEGSVVRVMASPKEKQIESARKAAREAKEAAEGEIAGALVFDCAVRGVILGDEFEKGVEAIREELGVPLIGFETYGEVCIERGQMSGYHNTTTVVMLIPE